MGSARLQRQKEKGTYQTLASTPSRITLYKQWWLRAPDTPAPHAVSRGRKRCTELMQDVKGGSALCWTQTRQRRRTAVTGWRRIRRQRKQRARVGREWRQRRESESESGRERGTQRRWRGGVAQALEEIVDQIRERVNATARKHTNHHIHTKAEPDVSELVPKTGRAAAQSRRIRSDRLLRQKRAEVLA
jgi:hypothetical protein